MRCGDISGLCRCRSPEVCASGLPCRGCKELSSWGLVPNDLVKCRRLKVVLLDKSGVGCTGIAYLMLRRRDLRLAEDLGSDRPWSFEPWASDAVILLKQAGVTLRDRRFVRFAFFLWAFDYMLVGLSWWRLAFWWLGLVLSNALPTGRQYQPATGLVHSHLAVLLPVVLRLRGFTSISQLGVSLLGLAIPGFTSTSHGAFVLHWAKAWAIVGRIASVNVSVGRWLVSPAFKRLCSKPTASRIIPFAAALSCAGWVLLSQLRRVLDMAMWVLPILPTPMHVLVMGLSIYIMLCLGVLGVCTLASLCSMAAMRE